MIKAASSGLSGRKILAAAAIYFAATALFFFPSFSSLSHSLIGPPEDNMFFLWSLWYGSASLAHPVTQLMHTSHIFYPEGISLFFCNYYYYGVALASALRLFLAMPLIYNLLVLHTFVLAGLGAFLLAHYLTGNFKASLLAGFIYGFNPSHFAHSLHHLTIASSHFVPFFMLFVFKAVRGGKKSDIFWASCFMTLDALCDWNYLVFDLLFLGLGLIYLLVKNRKNTGKIMARLVPVPVVSFVFLSPLIIPMIVAGLRHPFLGELPGHDTYVADFFGFFVPDPYHFLHAASAWIQKLNTAMTGNDWEKTVYLGLANLLLIAGALPWIRKEAGKYFLGLLAFMVLAMGSHAHFLGQALTFPFPYRLIQAAPFLTQARNPSRIIVYAYLFLAILAAFSFKKIISSLRPGIAAKAAAAALVLLVFFDFYSVSSAMTPVKLPGCFDVIRRDSDKNFGILELPWDGARYMMQQTIHGIPSVQGYMGRRLETTLIDRLSYDLKNLPSQKAMLIENHVKYIVLYKRKLVSDDSNPRDVSYRMVLSRVASIYARVYEKIHEDSDCAAYKVY